jgi:hypothetical protein
MDVSHGKALTILLTCLILNTVCWNHGLGTAFCPKSPASVFEPRRHNQPLTIEAASTPGIVSQDSTTRLHELARVESAPCERNGHGKFDPTPTQGNQSQVWLRSNLSNMPASSRITQYWLTLDQYAFSKISSQDPSQKVLKNVHISSDTYVWLARSTSCNEETVYVESTYTSWFLHHQYHLAKPNTPPGDLYSEVTRANPTEKIDRTAILGCTLELIGAAFAAQEPTQDKLSLSGLTEGMAMLLQIDIRLMTFMRIVRVLHHLHQSRTLLQVQTRLRQRSTTLKSMILGLFTHMLQLEKGIKIMLRSRNYLLSLSDLIFPMFLHLSLPIICTTADSLILAVCHTCSALMILRLMGIDLAEASLIRALAHFNYVRAHCLNKQIPRPRWVKRTLKRHRQTSLTFRYARRLCQHILMIKIPACITSRWEYLTNTGLRGGGLNSKSSIDSTPRGGGAWMTGTLRFTPQWQFETIPQDIHHEKQENLFCQCHTLSALFRRSVVTGQAML